MGSSPNTVWHAPPLGGGGINFATLNCNGLMTQIEDGSKPVYRIHAILKYFKRTNVQVFALQEPHVSGDVEPGEFRRCSNELLF